MKPILIIKAGTTLPLLKSTEGDFDDWIIAGTGKPRNDFIVSPVYEEVPLPQPDYVSGVIISGSHSNVTENLAWMERSSQWLVKAAEHNIPMLGICFGHQIIARAFGGKVGPNPTGWELGYLLLTKTAEAEPDSLFSILPNQFKVNVSHQQSVLKLPQGATILASSEKEVIQAYRINTNIWGVQFHPEFNASITQAYFNYHRHELISEGQNPPSNPPKLAQKEWGKVLLKQFVKIVENR